MDKTFLFGSFLLRISSLFSRESREKVSEKEEAQDKARWKLELLNNSAEDKTHRKAA